MEDVTSVNLHRFGTGLLVEILGRDQGGDISIRSYELEFVDDSTSVVHPRAPLSTMATALIDELLTEHGYTLTDAGGQNPHSKEETPGVLVS